MILENIFSLEKLKCEAIQNSLLSAPPLSLPTQHCQRWGSPSFSSDCSPLGWAFITSLLCLLYLLTGLSSAIPHTQLILLRALHCVHIYIQEHSNHSSLPTPIMPLLLCILQTLSRTQFECWEKFQIRRWDCSTCALVVQQKEFQKSQKQPSSDCLIHNPLN